MRCGFCFATFEDIPRRGQLNGAESRELLNLLCQAGFQKINFAGGEPTLLAWLSDLIRETKSNGLTTSIVTNGSRITPEWLDDLAGSLDIIALSIDSVESDTQRKIGRVVNGKDPIDAPRYRKLGEMIRERGIRLKVNTVVNRANHTEDFRSFILEMKPERWKIFQALPVTGQNDARIDEFTITGHKFEQYVQRNCSVESEGIRVVPEDNELMTGSYVMVDPLGRFFDDVSGAHKYSEPILDAGVAAALEQVEVDAGRFELRGGVYRGEDNVKDNGAEPWIIRQLGGIPAQADVALILRHAAREEIPAGSFGVDVPLTACGVASAERLGAMLPASRPHIRATSSPVPRCVSTAKAILRGRDRPEEVALDRRLGEPGPFVVDEEISGALFVRIGILEIVRHQLTHTTPPAGMRATSEGVDLLLGLAADGLGSGGRLDIYVTHDAILAVLVAHLYRLPVDDISWPGYLDGLLLWRHRDRLNFTWRGLEQRVLTHSAVSAIASMDDTLGDVSEHTSSLLHAECLPVALFSGTVAHVLDWDFTSDSIAAHSGKVVDRVLLTGAHEEFLPSRPSQRELESPASSP